MRRVIYPALMAGAALGLGGCGFADSRLPVPEFMRGKAIEPPPPEPPPDVKQLVREKLDAVFTANSYPRHVRVSSPLPDPKRSAWTPCIPPDLTPALAQ